MSIQETETCRRTLEQSAGFEEVRHATEECEANFRPSQRGEGLTVVVQRVCFSTHPAAERPGCEKTCDVLHQHFAHHTHLSQVFVWKAIMDMVFGDYSRGGEGSNGSGQHE